MIVRSFRFRRLVPTAATLVAALFAAGASAQPSFYEAEPNNNPAEANKVRGAVTIMGAFEGQDQDAFEWTVSDVDAQKRWTIELLGIPGSVTSTEIFRLAFAENGVDVLAKTKLLEINSNGIKPGRAEDLIFEPGEYYLGVARAGRSSGGYRLDVHQGRKLLLDKRAKSYDRQEASHKLKLRSEYAAFLDSPESWFQFELGDEEAGLRWQVKGQVPVGEKARGSVVDADGKTLSRVTGDNRGFLSSSDLELGPGSYFVNLPGKEGGAIRAIEVASTGPRVDAKPDVPAVSDSRPRATTSRWELAERVDLAEPFRGRFGKAKDLHYFAFSLDEPVVADVLTLRLEADTDRKVDLCLLDSQGKNLQCRRATGGVELLDLVLSAGEWGLSALGHTGNESDFTVALSSQGPIPSDSEAEPNDTAVQATGMTAEQEIHGRFAMKDEDFFSLLVTGDPQLWRFDVSGKGIVEIRYHDGAGVQSQLVRPDSGASAVSLSNLFLMPGKHHIAVKGLNGTYTLSAEALGPPHPDSELEPNDDASRAEILALGQNRFGTLESSGETDYYRFSLANDEHLRLSVEPPGDGQLHVWLDYTSKQIATQRTNGSQPAVLQGMFPPGDYQIRLGRSKPSRDRYHVKLERLPRFGCSVDCEPVQKRKIDFGDGNHPTSIADPLAVDIGLVPDADTVAAYLRLGQRVPARVRLQNKGVAPLTLELETATSDHRWSAVPAESNIALGPGETQVVALDIEVPPDAWGGQPVVISVRAFDGSGAQAETMVEIGVEGRADPVHSALAWPVPDEMLGGLNLAWSELGGNVVGVEEGSKPLAIPGVGRYMDLLVDGRVRPGVGPILEPGREVEALPITVKLAGSKPHEVVGILLNPVGRYNANQYLDEFELQLSADGTNFTTALRGRLKQLPQEQAFALEEPTPARYARLVVLTFHTGNLRQGGGVGEWKVVARPGIDISGASAWNLADPDLGGHVVWSRPVISGEWDRHILTEEKEHPSTYLLTGQSLEWAVSFQHQRAARITRFEWVDSQKVKPETRIDKVSVSVAVASPIGPWTKVAEWDRTRSPGELVLDEHVWARYVRFTYTGPKEKSRRYAPETLRIFEQPSDASYRSILGEWGDTSWPAQYELTQGLVLDADTETASGNNSRATAASLAFDQRIAGSVMLGEEEDWYKVVVPANGNTLKINLSGVPTLRTVVRLLDSSGSEVHLLEAGSQPDFRRYRAVVEPGQTYYLEVAEPPRAVVFAFDNSGSVTAFKTAIYRAVNAYAGDLLPGRDVANILPFGDSFLMSDWIGEPYILRMVLNDYDREAVSSEAEKSLFRSAKALEPRPGTKAVVMVTDAATPRFSAMWDALETVQPRVFTMRVGHADNTGLYEDLMQSWARVNDGHYDFLSTQGEMDRAFDRAATLLRQPAAYSLEASASFERDPGPGKLEIVSGDKNLGGAVALILDASGSMLKRMEGTRRIEIAKDLLSKAVTEHIPAGTPVALRVFGHKEANSCRTDLVVPMKPLDPAAVAKTLDGINAKNLAKTPIADSLAKIESDLKGAKGKRVVVLVTDGEETCDGDPAAVLQKLADRGIDLRLEIVGFAIADDDLKQQFEGWAKQGGGRYFDAGDAASLERSLAEALQVPYSVFDQNGSLVAQGTVDGEVMELDAGQYRVTIATSPPTTIEDVEVRGGQQVVLEAGGS